jgi:hypothetical protein
VDHQPLLAIHASFRLSNPFEKHFESSCRRVMM